MDEEQLKNNSENGNAPLSGMLGTLLSNPDLLRRVGSILGAAQSAPSNATDNAAPTSASPAPPNQTAEETPAASPTSSGGALPQDGLATLLSDPAMLEKLPQIISVMKPLLTSMPAAKPQEPAPAPQKSQEVNRDQLLLALKPFLSPERCEAVDSIIRISKLGTVFKQLK